MVQSPPRDGVLLIRLALGLALTACGGGSASTDDPDLAFETTGGETAGDEPGTSKEGKPSAREVLGTGGPEQPWEAMTFEEREFYMIGKVLPITQEMFKVHDAKEFASLECETCHGKDMRERKFEMPSGELPAVPRPGTEAYEGIRAALPDMVQFMEEEVTPTVASMLGFETTGTSAFGCADCHPVAE